MDISSDDMFETFFDYSLEDAKLEFEDRTTCAYVWLESRENCYAALKVRPNKGSIFM